MENPGLTRYNAFSFPFRISATAMIFRLILLFALICVSSCEKSLPNANPDDAQQVARGKQFYDQNCARCHGENMSGESDWRKRKDDGKLPAPPHDESGHTWHHPDKLLFGIVKHGLVPPYAPANYSSNMPSFAGKLTDQEIWDTLAYIKSRWSADIQEKQRQIDRSARD
jgi:mono/diheme cytochrome c family protein